MAPSNLAQQRDAIAVTIKFLSAVRDIVGHKSETVSLPLGSTLRTIAAYLESAHGLTVPSSEVMATFRGAGWEQSPQGPETPLVDGDEIQLFPPIGGG
jgi:molybdopterin converting factor small subunit